MATKLVRVKSVRLLAALAAIGSLAVLVVASDRSPSTASRLEASCTVALPSRLDVDRPMMTYQATKTCTGISPDEVSWTGRVGASEPLHELWFLFEDTISGVYYDSQPLTSWRWTGSVPIDPAAARPMADIVFNSPVTDIRLKSRSTLTLTRPSSSTVTLKTHVDRYAYSLDKFVPWVGTTGQYQWRPAGTTEAWKALKTFQTDASGNFTYSTAEASGAPSIEYQVYYPSDPNIFGNASNAVRS